MQRIFQRRPVSTQPLWSSQDHARTRVDAVPRGLRQGGEVVSKGPSRSLVNGGNQWESRRGFTSTISRTTRAQPDFVAHEVSTFDPNLLQPQDFCDLSLKARSVLRPSDPKISYVSQVQTKYDIPWSGPSVFPPGSRGFFYYHLPPGLSSIAGEIRFRTTPTPNPASFSQGADLLMSSGMPWRLQILPGLNFSIYRFIWDLLLRDRLVTPADLSECQSVLQNSPGKPHVTADILHSLDQPFVVDFCTRQITLWIVYGGRMARILLNYPFCFNSMPVYKGGAIVHFERSTAPEYAGKGAFMIYVLKILGQVESIVPNYDGRLQKPKEGSPLMVRKRSGQLGPYVRVMKPGHAPHQLGFLDAGV